MTSQTLHPQFKPALRTQWLQVFLGILICWYEWVLWYCALFVWLIIGTFLVNEQYFSLTTNQSTVLLAWLISQMKGAKAST